VDELLRRAVDGYRRAFGGKPDGCWAAPGRINVLGEHTDYNDGFVLPYAIPFYTMAAVSRSQSPTWRVWSEASGETVTFGPARVAETLSRYEAVDGWAGYVAGIVWALKHVARAKIGGARIALASDVPMGAGLSSSAALELAVLSALRDLFALDLSPQDQISVAQAAENEYVGAPTGILDQTASLLSRPDHMLFMDCRNRELEHIPFRPGDNDYDMVVVDTNTSHSHADNEYADRRNDCERAARFLGVDSLRDVSRDGYLDLPDMVLRRRVRHVVTENHRTTLAARAMKTGQERGLRILGELMTDSHLSMMADYEITVPALDHAVAAAIRGGARGARMTGGGFGGSVIALVPSAKTEQMCAEISRTAQANDLPQPQYYLAEPAAGAHQVAG
jgi:galactokinase